MRHEKNSVYITFHLGKATVNERIESQQQLYIRELERLLVRRSDIVEIQAVKDAFVRQWTAIEAAKLISNAARDRRRSPLEPFAAAVAE